MPKGESQSGNGSTESKKSGHNPLKHLGMMGICCILPFVIISSLPLLNINKPGANTLISGISSLICPIMMGVMMLMMFRGNKKHDCCKDEGKQNLEQ
jgi:hypothetical protein